MHELRYATGPEDDGRPLIRLLRGNMSVSYSAVKSAKWDGRILVNGEPAHTDRTVRAGDVIVFRFPENDPVYIPKPYPLALSIPYRDEHLIIADKPAPLATQSSARHTDDTLENAMYSYFGCPRSYIFRPVNRLDKGTSGLMAIALSAHIQQLMQKALHTPDFERRYLAVTEGVPASESGIIELPIIKAPGATVRRETSPDGRPSVTEYRVMRARHGRALLELRLRTGRTHQIRVHLKSIGCPVCGDFLYGTELPELPGRFALHSAYMAFLHPITGERTELSSPLPDELSGLLRE